MRVEDGKATIGLWEEWPALLAEVPAFGNVLAISRNSYAVLGTISRYPDLDLVPVGSSGARRTALWILIFQHGSARGGHCRIARARLALLC